MFTEWSAIVDVYRHILGSLGTRSFSGNLASKIAAAESGKILSHNKLDGIGEIRSLLYQPFLYHLMSLQSITGTHISNT